jgi:hypothetical protein
MRAIFLIPALMCAALPAYAGDAAMRALEATIQQQAIIQQQQREQQMRQQQEQMRQREAAQQQLISGPDGKPLEADGKRTEQQPAR